jgi:phytanoyl-CoA hydroxylase
MQYTQPPTALGFWIALEQCTESNGALYFLPGSHLTTPITKRLVRLVGGGTGFESLSHSNEIQQGCQTGEYVMVPCEPGPCSYFPKVIFDSDI